MPRKGLNLLLRESAALLYMIEEVILSYWEAGARSNLVMMVVHLQQRFLMLACQVPKEDALICRGTCQDLCTPIV